MMETTWMRMHFVPTGFTIILKAFERWTEEWSILAIVAAGALFTRLVMEEVWFDFNLKINNF